MKQYTGMYIIRPNATEEEIGSIIDTINAVFTADGGKVLSVDKWGLKDLAYEINDFTKGYYVKFQVEANAAGVAEYNRRCNISEKIIRHIIVKDE